MRTPSHNEGEAIGGQHAVVLETRAPEQARDGMLSLQVRADMRAADLVRHLTSSKAMPSRIFERSQLMRADGTALARQDQVACGDELLLRLLVTREPGPTSDAAIDVLYEDPLLLAVDKPAGVLVHGDGSDSETLTARVQGYLTKRGSAAVPQALHRLDVDTSGIVLFSLTEELQPAFDALVSGNGLTKRYFALVEGELPKYRGDWLVVDAPIARDRHDARRMRVGRTGKQATTLLRTCGHRGSRTLVEAELVTGRRHQIRVHLAHLGCPIVGDALYGGARNASGLLLHAHEVRLAHPVSGERLVVTSPLPKRFSR